jgi:hypothetical protein
MRFAGAAWGLTVTIAFGLAPSGCQIVAGLDQPLVAPGDASTSSDAGDGGAGAAYAAAVLADKPLVYYRLDEATGTVARDASGNGIDATLIGAVLGATGALKNDPSTALELGSPQAKLSIPNAFDFPGPSPYAFELWIAPETTTGEQEIFNKYEPRSPSIEGTIAYFGTPGPGGIILGFERWHQPELDAYVHQLSVGLVAGVYNHLVFTSDGGTPRMYLNGIRYDGFTKQPGVGPDKLNVPLEFGGFKGKLDEVAVYDHDLAETRVLAHHRIGKTGS